MYKYLIIDIDFGTTIVKRELTDDELQSCVDGDLSILNLLEDTEYISDGESGEWLPIETE